MRDDQIIKFTSYETESRFRLALGGIKSVARIERAGDRTTLYLRPENLLVFGASVNRQGLEQCVTTKKILRSLDKNKDLYLRFEHSADDYSTY